MTYRDSCHPCGNEQIKKFVLLIVGALSLMRNYGKASSRNIPVLGDENGSRISTCFLSLSSRRSKFANDPAAPIFNRLAIHFKRIVVSKRPHSDRAQTPAVPESAAKQDCNWKITEWATSSFTIKNRCVTQCSPSTKESPTMAWFRLGHIRETQMGVV
jgi:hypothetical protein